MNSKTVIELLLTVAIATFAGLSWLATKRCAYVTGLALFIQANRDIVGNAVNPERGTAIAP